jgi:hypothetical protein
MEHIMKPELTSLADVALAGICHAARCPCGAGG